MNEDRRQVLYGEYPIRPPTYSVHRYIQYLKDYVSGTASSKASAGRHEGKTKAKRNGAKSDALNPLSYFLRKLKLDLKTSYSNFVSDFIAPPYNGLRLLLTLLKNVHGNCGKGMMSVPRGGGGSSSSSLHIEEYKQNMVDELDCLLCIKYTLRIESAMEEITENDSGLHTIVSCCLSHFQKSRIAALEILSLLVTGPSAVDKILEAFTGIRVRYSETTRFKMLLNMLYTRGVENVIFQISTLRLLNALCNMCRSPNMRVFLQYEMEEAGLDLEHMEQTSQRHGLEYDDLHKQIHEWKTRYIDVSALLKKIKIDMRKEFNSQAVSDYSFDQQFGNPLESRQIWSHPTNFSPDGFPGGVEARGRGVNGGWNHDSQLGARHAYGDTMAALSPDSSQEVIFYKGKDVYISSRVDHSSSSSYHHHHVLSTRTNQDVMTYQDDQPYHHNNQHHLHHQHQQQHQQRQTHQQPQQQYSQQQNRQMLLQQLQHHHQQKLQQQQQKQQREEIMYLSDKQLQHLNQHQKQEEKTPIAQNLQRSQPDDHNNITITRENNTNVATTTKSNNTNNNNNITTSTSTNNNNNKNGTSSYDTVSISSAHLSRQNTSDNLHKGNPHKDTPTQSPQSPQEEKASNSQTQSQPPQTNDETLFSYDSNWVFRKPSLPEDGRRVSITDSSGKNNNKTNSKSKSNQTKSPTTEGNSEMPQVTSQTKNIASGSSSNTNTTTTTTEAIVDNNPKNLSKTKTTSSSDEGQHVLKRQFQAKNIFYTGPDSDEEITRDKNDSTSRDDYDDDGNEDDSLCDNDDDDNDDENNKTQTQSQIKTGRVKSSSSSSNSKLTQPSDADRSVKKGTAADQVQIQQSKTKNRKESCDAEEHEYKPKTKSKSAENQDNKSSQQNQVASSSSRTDIVANFVVVSSSMNNDIMSSAEKDLTVQKSGCVGGISSHVNNKDTTKTTTGEVHHKKRNKAPPTSSSSPGDNNTDDVIVKEIPLEYDEEVKHVLMELDRTLEVHGGRTSSMGVEERHGRDGGGGGGGGGGSKPKQKDGQVKQTFMAYI